MHPLDWIRKTLLAESDVLADYRARIILPVGIASLVLMLPFLLSNVWLERYPVAAAILAAQLVLLVDLVAIRANKPLPVPMPLLAATLVATLLFTIWRHGTLGAFWSYPVVLICYFSLPRRMALVCSVSVLVLASGFLGYWFDGAMGLRVFATLLLTIVMINIILNVLAELQGALLRLAITDPLTGAFNRRHMDQMLERMVQQGLRRFPNNALLMLDVDNFKDVNDRFGHALGDQVLRKLVAVVGERKRQLDVLFRTGGEEFVLLLVDIDRENALKVAELLRRRIEEATLVEGQVVTVSIGVSMQNANENAEDWLKRADRAVYQAKDLGRNQIVMA